MKTIGLFWVLHFFNFCAHAQFDGVNAMVYSGAPITLNYTGDNFDGVTSKRSLGFQFNIPLKTNFKNFKYEISLGNDSYNVNLEPHHSATIHVINYVGFGLGYQVKKITKANNFIGATLYGSVYNFITAGSGLDINPFSERNFKLVSYVSTNFKYAFVPKLSFSYNWQTENQRFFSLGLNLATSFQDVLRGEFVVRDGTQTYEGRFYKKYTVIGVHFGINVSGKRKKEMLTNKKEGLPKFEERQLYTFNKFSMVAGFGLSNPVFVQSAFKNEIQSIKFDNYRLPTYFIAASRSFKILNRFEGVFELAFRQVQSSFSYELLHSNSKEIEHLRLPTNNIVSAGLGYNFLRNRKQKKNFFQLIAMIKGNYSFLEKTTYQVANPETGETLFDLETAPYPTFISTKLNFEYNLKHKSSSYWRIGFFFDRGSFLTEGDLRDDSGPVAL